MGAWDIGSFSNDDALDWVKDLQDEDDLNFLEDTFSKILDRTGYLPEASECSVVLAAGEVIAAMLGQPMGDLPEEVRDWLAGKDMPETRLVRKAREAIAIVGSKSELKDLWRETDQFSAWGKKIETLLMRLT